MDGVEDQALAAEQVLEVAYDASRGGLRLASHVETSERGRDALDHPFVVSQEPDDILDGWIEILPDELPSVLRRGGERAHAVLHEARDGGLVFRDGRGEVVEEGHQRRSADPHDRL